MKALHRLLALALIITLACGCSAKTDTVSAATGPSDGEATLEPQAAPGVSSTPLATVSVDTKLKSVDTVSEATQSRYAEREIHEYRGVRLDPAVGPADNSINGVQYVDISGYTLRITGLADEPQTYSYDEVLAFDAYGRLTTLYCIGGWTATILWEGVLLTDLFDAAGIQDDANTVIFKAADGYTTSLPRDIVEKREMILAYKSNGVDIPPEMGYPFIVVAEDKLGYKWARWVTEIELSDDEDYLGYWEEKGYFNEANIPHNFK